MSQRIPKPPSQRQLRVGEEVRHALSTILMQRKYFDHPLLEGVEGITVSEVRVSADLRNATAFVTPLGGTVPSNYIEGLNDMSPKLRNMVNKMVVLKFSPKIIFRHDHSYENASRIDALLQSVKSTETEDEE